MAFRTTKRYLAAAACLALLNSCAVLEKQVKQPEVSVADVRIVNMSLSDVQLAFDLDVANPNPFGISTRGMSYRLEIQDKSLFDGALAKKLNLKANGTSALTLPFTLRFEDVIGSLSALQRKEAIRYRLSGDVDLGLLKIPYSKSGTFSLPELPRISVKRLRIERFTLSGVELGVDLDIRNANSFPIRFDGLDYQLKLAQSSLLKGKSTQPVSVNSKGSGTMKLKLAVDYASLGAAAQQLRGGKSLPIEFNSQMNLPGRKGEALPFSWKGNVPLSQ